MSLALDRQLSRLSCEITRAAAEGNGSELSSLLAAQRELVNRRHEEIDGATQAALRAGLEKALRSAKIRRQQVLDAIKTNQRRLGVLQAYQTGGNVGSAGTVEAA
jgi:hypothetical protein